MQIYFPYPSDKQNKKYYIITSTGKKVYFGQAKASDFTEHKDVLRKNRYILRHYKREHHLWNKSGIDTPSFWSRFYTWNLPTKEASYNYIKRKFLL